MQKITLVVEDGVSAMLTELAGSERKRGAWISQMVKSIYEKHEQVQASDVDTLKLDVLGLVAQYKMIDARLSQMERQVVGLIGKKWRNQQNDRCVGFVIDENGVFTWVLGKTLS